MKGSFLCAVLALLFLAGCAGTSKLTQAVKAKDHAAVDKMLAAGSLNLEKKDKLGNKAIAYAASNRDMAMIEKLIAKGADPQQGLRVASWGGYQELIDYFLGKGARFDAGDIVYVLAANGKVEQLKIVLKRGANVERPGTVKDWTPLFIAATLSQREAARVLIAHGANVDKALIQLEANRADWAGKTFKYATNQSMQATEIAQAAGGITLIKSLTATAAARPAPPPPAPKPAPRPAPRLHSDVDTPSYRYKENPTDFALVVGVGMYSDLPEARFAARDAEAVKDHLIALGYPSRNVILLKDSKAAKSSLEKYLEAWLPRNVTRKSRVFFYFSGHGAPDTATGKAYLVPWDGDPSFLKNTAYPVERLYRSLEKLEAKEVIVALDACFSGAGGRSVLAKGARPLVVKVNKGAAPSGRIAVFAAASDNEITTTLENQGHGMFTYYFLKGLNGAAWNAKNGVTARGLFDYLKPEVQDSARRQNRSQSPTYHQGKAGQLLLRP